MPGNCLSAVYGLPWRVFPTMDDPELTCSFRVVVPLLSRLSALLGAPAGSLVICTMYEKELKVLLAACTWRAPLLERVLLGGTATCLQAALETLQLRPSALAGLPRLLQLPAAALIVWRRSTLGRSGRQQVRAVVLTLLAMTPPGTPVKELGLTWAAAGVWRDRTAPLRFEDMPEELFDQSAMHLYNELQHVYQVALSVNEVLRKPLEQLDLVDALHIWLTMRLGFVSSDEGTDSDDFVRHWQTGSLIK